METAELELVGAYIDLTSLNVTGGITEGLPVDRPITLSFSAPIDESSIKNAILLELKNQHVDFRTLLLKNETDIAVYPIGVLQQNSLYTLTVTDELRTKNGKTGEHISIAFRTTAGELEIISLSFNNKLVNPIERIIHVPTDISMRFKFSDPVDHDSFWKALNISGTTNSNLNVTWLNNDSTAHLKSYKPLKYLSKHVLELNTELRGADGAFFPGFSTTFYTQFDSTYKYPVISDEELLTTIQEQTFKYFWDFAHPVSGLNRERNTSNDLVTTGGSGFGIMSIIVGIERGFITHQEGVDRLKTIVSFLGNKADRFHGAWSHWLSGSTGEVIPFSSDDDGGDLVETAFMVQGLYTVRQYLNNSDQEEANLISMINDLIDEVEWDWYTQGGQDVLYWHWSPEYNWQKNMKITGWNEALIVYVLAASSTTHTIDKEVYENGWARNGNMVNHAGNEYFGYQLPLRKDMGGPLFFAHYSFLGLDPRNLQDQYANYWTQNVIHSKINRAYCIANPNNYIGYSENCWGLTASDGNNGYSAHSPGNDRGVITPTAAISSLPYTPEESLEAIRFFYYIMGDKLWGEHGFYDAFNITAEWYANSYIAIDQGPIICMIENYRTGKLWELFMSAPEIQNGLSKLGFTY